LGKSRGSQRSEQKFGLINVFEGKIGSKSITAAFGCCLLAHFPKNKNQFLLLLLHTKDLKFCIQENDTKKEIRKYMQ
jgi:hypothetical protein